MTETLAYGYSCKIFQTTLRPCPFDESSLSIERVHGVLYRIASKNISINRIDKLNNCALQACNGVSNRIESNRKKKSINRINKNSYQ